MKYYFVRHGQSEANAAGIVAGSSDPILTVIGREQAKKTGDHLKTYGISTIYSSPYLRAKQTAEIVADCLGVVHVEVLEDLKERCLGETENKPKDMPSAWYIENDSERGFETHAGSFIYERMQKLFLNLKKHMPKEGNVLLVGHGACGFFLRQYAKGKRNFAECDTAEEMNNAEIIRVSTVW